MSVRIGAAGVLTGVLVLGLAGPAMAEPAGQRVRLVSEQVLGKITFQGTTVGGLSGIDYDRRTGEWVLICDDRSDRQPVRYYTARQGKDGFELTGTKPLLRPDGSTYPKLSLDTPDPEEIRIDPLSGDLWWTSEGDRLPPVLIDPAIRRAHRDGTFAGELPLPANLHMSVGEQGPRRNEVLEGLAFAAGGHLVVSTVEGPLIQDGLSPTPAAGALGRISVQNRAGRLLSQYAYPMEKVFAEPVPAGAFANNGVVAILPVDEHDPHRYLVLERSFVTGVGNKVRIYEINTAGATDVKKIDSLAGAEFRPVRKKLIADLGALGLSTVDNVEGMTWGPRLPTGERSLVLVSDDNFSATQVSQLITLAVR
ncbi:MULTISPECIES: esterase-like activity of phytase family protein [unclassified Crossiella]|uniref:esterase-like activity of phytase family protein n=1 Tax=unclassified Crossiella TaxID=2620835 RepID=UPI001FFE47AA|nr:MULTISPECIES: esterase-like activity of phytase family protein [unclassified Crossiella]MCK2236248.1 esterase-like activity of phytase family protein [Crossiella sp. S99.2]MCK2249915.1 esterase-like activity of phytase family protein [Crossiella sp. S99.1]